MEEKDLNFTIPPALYEAINAESERQGQTKAALIRAILNEWNEKRKARLEHSAKNIG